MTTQVRYRKTVVPLVFLLFVALLVTSCGGAAPAAPAGPAAPEATTAPAAPAPAEKVKLQLTYPGGAAEYETMQKVIEASAAELPNIEVEIIHIAPAEYWDKVTTMFAGGSAPDVTFMSEPLRQYATNDSLLALDDLIKSDPDVDVNDFYKVGLEFFQYNGKQYGLPKDLNTYVTFYNEDLFKEAGLKTPMEYYQEGNWTWDTYAQLAQALTKRDGDRVTQFGTAYPTIGGWYYSAWIFSNGGKILNDDRTQCEVTDPRTVETFQFTVDLANKYKAAPSPASQGGTQITGMTFATGKVAMEVGGTWGASGYMDAPFKWNIAPVPTGHSDVDKLVGYIHNAGYAISKSTKHPQEAWQLLKALVSVKTQTGIAGSLGTFPSRKSVVETGANLKGVPDGFKIVPDILEHGKLFPFTPTYNQEDRIYTTNGDLLLNGQLTAQEAAQKMCDEVNAILSGKQ